MRTRQFSSFSASARIVQLICLSSILLGCASTFRGEPQRPVNCTPMEIFARADAGSYSSAKVGIFPFSTPHYAAEAAHELTTIYYEETLRNGIFKQVVVIPHEVRSDGEAIWWGRREQCSLVMIPTLSYMIDGSGALTNQLVVAIRIVDTRSGKLLWYFTQKASSAPGADIDLVWSTIPGQPARGYRALARFLAQQTPQVLLPPPAPEDQKPTGPVKWTQTEQGQQVNLAALNSNR